MRVDDHLGEASHPWNLSKSCPEGSIPIQAVHKNGHLRDNPFVNHWYKDSLYSLWQTGTENRKHGLKGREDEEAVLHSSIAVRGGKYYGSKTSMNVWNPKVGNKYEYSISQIWVSSADERTSLEAGWAVFPDLYGEDKTRFFIRWTTDNYKTGCYNLRCPGFIQTNCRTILDSYLQPISVYGGPQYFIDVEIFKDRATGNWWLRLQGVEIGYWPMELVLSLAGGARFLSFGGVVTTSRSALQTSTEMGSGHLSNEGFKKSSFFKNVQVLDASYTYRNPDPGLIRTLMECPACYDLQVGQTKDGPWGFFFSYGGPGRSGKRT